MALKRFTGKTKVISELGTTPQERGLTADEFKAKFDEFAEEFVQWFNETHCGEVDSIDSDLQSHKAENAKKHIHSSGSNENGSYIKYDDGTMKCFASEKYPNTEISSIDVPNIRYTRKTMIFPHIFTAIKSVVSSAHVAGYAGYVGQTTINSTQANFMICVPGTTTQTRDIEVHYVAMGRWKE